MNEMNNRILIVPEGITKLHTEAVVNAANEQLRQGSGVCGAIFRAAGETQLQKACDAIGHCDTGSAVITPAFLLKDADYIIHAVGPIWQGGTRREQEKLYQAYMSALYLAKKHNCSSIGFPLISTGIFGYPVDMAWDVALLACKDFFRQNPDYELQVKFGVPDDQKRELGLRRLETILPDTETDFVTNPAEGEGIGAAIFELLRAPNIANSFPELHAYLSGIVNEDGSLIEDPYEAANRILLCDRPAVFPGEVIEIVAVLFQTAFAAGNAEAMNDLGAQYYDGSRGFDQDFSKAVACYRLAAEKGSRQAQENLGYCYYYGRNMPVDYEKAFHYFALGAFDGHLISLYKIGDMYANGYYVEKNEREAFLIYERCMDTMTDEAAKAVAGPVFLRLGKCFLEGVGVERDPESALVCYQKAEVFLFNMVRDGNYMYKKSLRAAVDGQAKARSALAGKVPEEEWIYE